MLRTFEKTRSGGQRCLPFIQPIPVLIKAGFPLANIFVRSDFFVCPWLELSAETKWNYIIRCRQKKKVASRVQIR